MVARKQRWTKNLTPEQKKHRLVHEEGKTVLPYWNYTADCPKRGGPSNPHPEYPGKIGLFTCSGCKFNKGFYALGRICTHQYAKRVSAEMIRKAGEQKQGVLL